MIREGTIDADSIKLELESVATSDTFVRSSRMQELLRYLVENDLAGNGDRLKSVNIAIDVFGRDADFDSNNDSIVRVEAARLRRMLGAHYAAHPEARLEISIPKGRYQPAYERREPKVAPPLHRPIGGPGIAVLPFVSTDDEELLCDGLTAELRFQLSRFAEFRVVDASHLSDTPAAELLPEIADTLECQYLVKGRITGTRNGKRIYVEALDATNSHVLWSERIEVETHDTALLDMEEEIATAIARALAPSPGPLVVNGFERGDRPPHDWDAIDCVLRWHYYRAHLRSQETFDGLNSALKGLLENHPGFSMGWAMLGYMTIDAWIYRMLPGTPFVVLERSARTYAGRALGLAPRNSPARYVLALCDYFAGNYEGFREHFFAALDFNPNSLDLLHHGGTLLAFSGNWDEGREIVLEADLGHCNSMGLRFFYVVDALRDGDIELADSLLSVVKPQGNWYWGYLLRAAICAQRDDLANARVAINAALTDCPDLTGDLDAEAAKWLGDTRARTLLQTSFARILAS